MANKDKKTNKMKITPISQHTGTTNLVAEILALQKLTTDELQEIAISQGVDSTDVLNMSDDDLRQKIAEYKVAKTITKELPNSSADELKTRAQEILARATELNDQFNNATPAEREILLDELDKKFAIKGWLNESFNFSGKAIVPASTDLPLSSIITNLPIRVIEQMLLTTSVTYPLFSAISNMETVANGIKDVFYKDYSDTDTKTGYSDVEIGDFNPGKAITTYKETYRVDKNIHKGYDILDTILNDVTISVGLFIALVNDFEFAIVKPFAKRMYQELITWLDSDATSTYDEVVTFADATDINKQAKELKNKLISLSTPSRTHLKQKPVGATTGLEYQLNLSNAILILDKSWSTDYKFDITSGVFNIGEIAMKVGEIVETDMTLLEEYSNVATASQVLKNYKVILIEKGIYNFIMHYSATKQVNTPKLKQVFHRYDRFGSYRHKNKIAIAFKTA